MDRKVLFVLGIGVKDKEGLRDEDGLWNRV